MTSLFVLGATGYIGGAVLLALQQELPGLKVTALVRNEKYTETLSKLGITPVTGSNEDLALITQLASKADIVLNVADADADTMVKAILDGCKLHFEETGTKALFVHTSGVAVLGDNAEGTFNPSTPVYDDRNVALLKSIPATAVHRNVEQRVVDADEAGYVSAYIISPGTIYGDAATPIPRVPLLISLMLGMSRVVNGVPILGPGSNVVNFIHIKDVASVYAAVIKYALSGKDKEVGWGKYYFASGYEIPWNAVAKALGVAFHKRRALDNAEPIAASTTQLPYLRFFGGNTRAFPGRATQLGWRLTQPSFFEVLDQDVDLGLKG